MSPFAAFLSLSSRQRLSVVLGGVGMALVWWLVPCVVGLVIGGGQ